MDALTRTRQQLDDLLAELIADRAAVDAEAAVVARAFEQLTVTPGGLLLLQQGGDAMRWKVLALIDHQMAYLDAASISHTVLTTLRRMVLEVEA
jgi:hypothetical protein